MHVLFPLAVWLGGGHSGQGTWSGLLEYGIVIQYSTQSCNLSCYMFRLALRHRVVECALDFWGVLMWGNALWSSTTDLYITGQETWPHF